MNMACRPQGMDFSAAKPDAIPTYDARELIAQGVQARVLLDGQTYFLRITRAGKLILTK